MIPAFIAVTAGKVGNQTQTREFKFPHGSVVVFDKSYASYDWHKSLSTQGVSYVTRMRSNAQFEVLKTHAVVANSGVLSDETIAYSGTKAVKQGLLAVRRIMFRDATL